MVVHCYCRNNGDKKQLNSNRKKIKINNNKIYNTSSKNKK